VRAELSEIAAIHPDDIQLVAVRRTRDMECIDR
jgi:hypothetical protein